MYPMYPTYLGQGGGIKKGLNLDFTKLFYGFLIFDKRIFHCKFECSNIQYRISYIEFIIFVSLLHGLFRLHNS